MQHPKAIRAAQFHCIFYIAISSLSSLSRSRELWKHRLTIYTTILCLYFLHATMRLFLLALASTVLALPTEDAAPRAVKFQNLDPRSSSVPTPDDATGIVLQYYTDTQCTQYLLSFKPAMYYFYNYQYSGTQSANIVKCPVTGPSNGLCHCAICDQRDGKGNCYQISVNRNLQPVYQGTPNCAYGLNAQSMYCEYK